MNIFSYGIEIIDGTETEKTVDVRVKATKRGMVYWLLQHYDVAALIENKDEELWKELRDAVESLYERYCK